MIEPKVIGTFTMDLPDGTVKTVTVYDNNTYSYCHFAEAKIPPSEYRFLEKEGSCYFKHFNPGGSIRHEFEAHSDDFRSYEQCFIPKLKRVVDSYHFEQIILKGE